MFCLFVIRIQLSPWKYWFSTSVACTYKYDHQIRTQVERHARLCCVFINSVDTFHIENITTHMLRAYLPHWIKHLYIRFKWSVLCACCFETIHSYYRTTNMGKAWIVTERFSCTRIDWVHANWKKIKRQSNITKKMLIC